MRTFIAIELPEEIKDALAQLQEDLKKSGADVKWVEPKNIHLTLKFLGEIDEIKAQNIIKIIEEIAQGLNSFKARISSVGAFPKLNFPRVIWAGVDEGDEEICKIASGLEQPIAKLGIPKEDRKFSSHITIGRTRSTLNREKLVQELSRLATESGQVNLEFTVTKITFFKSTLTSGGPIYEALNEAHLKTI